MKIGSLFSGIGGLELGLEWAGLGHTVWQVEEDEHCREVLARHWPEANREVTDVRDAPAGLVPVDLICGGFPCQDISSANLTGRGLAGPRSGLWFEFARVVESMGPRWVIVENVASDAEWVDPVVEELERIGYHCLPVPISTSDVGAPQSRPRIFVLARRVSVLHRSEQPTVGQYAEMESTPETQEYCHRGWPTQLGMVPSVHGVSGRVVRQLSNAVVPQCAEVIGHMIREIDEHH